MPLDKNKILDRSALSASVADGPPLLETFKGALKAGRVQLADAHRAGASAGEIIQTHSWLIDQLLQSAWDQLAHPSGSASSAELIAVGGYGRRELHPCSDIDLLILFSRSHTSVQAERIEIFVRFLWDMGLEVGHSVRTLKDCTRQASADITVVTNLMEARLLAGNGDLLERLHKQIQTSKMWSARKFFAAKRAEQMGRHARYGDTAHNLEPHIKEGPGGLRDIQTIQWVAHRYFGTPDLEELVHEGFLTREEVDALLEGRHFLWRLRNALHFHTGRCEDRLLFDYQSDIAHQFRYKDSAQLAVEKLMKRYFRTVKELRVLNEILLQHFEEAILYPGKKHTVRINRRFRAVDGMIEVVHPDVFARQPFALIEAFLLLIQDRRVRGIRGSTVRLMRSSVNLIDAEFRRDIRCRSLFMEIMKSSTGQTHTLRTMSTYGILGAYIPAFGRVVGQMQHDLFHVYTVDAHLLFVVRNLRRMDITEHNQELPQCSRIMQGLFKKFRLYLAALFHDIAKGRGGDHSTLGERDALRFCKLHDLSDYDANFVSWLVRTHLLMSWVAQREDITEPEVIDRFAVEVGDQERLDNLYLLTVADMRGTSPKVWNDWKGKLLSDLYDETSRALRRGVGSPLQADQKLQDLKNETLQLLGCAQTEAIKPLWDLFDQDYFLRNSPDVLAWHTTQLLERQVSDLPLVDARLDSDSSTVRFFICSPDSEKLLCDVTAGFDRLNMNIVDARVHRMRSNLVIMVFVVLNSDRRAPSASDLTNAVDRLRVQLLDPTTSPSRGRARIPRTLKHFPIETVVRFSESATGDTTVMEVIAQDRPGLLLGVAKALLSCKIRLVNAKVGTFGERAEDIFFITDRDGGPVTNASQKTCITEQIRAALPVSTSPMRRA